jgi:hypothetical protein
MSAGLNRGIIRVLHLALRIGLGIYSRTQIQQSSKEGINVFTQ